MSERLKKILLHGISALLILAIFYFLWREFAKNWEQIRAFEFNFHFGMLALSSLVYAAAFFIFAMGWHIFLQYIHHPMPLSETLLAFFITQPAKYIPGKVWIGLARMKFCKPHGIPHSVTLLSTGTEAVMEIFAGAYVSLVALLQTDLLGKFSIWGIVALTSLGMLLLIPKIFYFFINLYLRIVRLPHIPSERHTTFVKLLLLQLMYVAGMLGLGVSQLLFLQSFAPVEASHFPFLISLGAFSYIASILAIFVPGGLGVREGIWYLALSSVVLPSVALIYSFVSRIWMIGVEALLAFIGLLVFYIGKNAKIVVK